MKYSYLNKASNLSFISFILLIPIVLTKKKLPDLAAILTAIYDFMFTSIDAFSR